MEPPKTPSQELFEKVTERLVKEVVRGKTHLKIGRGVAEAIHADVVIGGVSPVFWGTTIWAHLEVAQLIASKLFDQHRDAMNVKYLIKLAEQSAGSFQKATPAKVREIICDAREKIDKLEPVLNTLKEKRNKILAHFDPKVVKAPERLAGETKVPYTELERVYETAGDVLNKFSAAYRDATNWLELLHDDDFNHAIQLIADAKHHRADMFEEEHGSPAPFLRPKRPKSNS